MPHLRKAIRDAVAVAVTGLATTGARVHRMRVHSLSGGELPALLIYPVDEQAEAAEQGEPAILERDLRFTVEGVAENADAEVLEDTLDLIALEVETALGGDPTLGGLVHDLQLERTEWAADGAGRKPVGRIGIGFRAKYHTAADAPGEAA